jgi:hypothetical protein
LRVNGNGEAGKQQPVAKFLMKHGSDEW